VSETKIVSKLKEALKTSCNEAFYFSDNETKLIDAEYLLTVNAAKAIYELNTYFGEPYKICLEHNTEKFSTACTPVYGRESSDNCIGYRTIVQSKKYDSERSGKIDIAIYTKSQGSEHPLCAIEVKGFNPSKNLIIKDLKRNSEYFGISSATGTSSIKFTVFIGLHSYKGVWDDKREERNISKLRTRYEKYIGSANLECLSHKIDIFTISRGTLPVQDDPEWGLQGNEDYQFVGVILTTKKPINS